VFAPAVESATERLKKLNDALIAFVDKLKDPKQALDELKQKIVDFYTNLSPLAKGVLGVISAFMLVKFASLAWSLFVGAIKLGGTIIMTIFSSLLNWPVALAAAAFMLYVAWEHNWFNIRDVVNKVWGKIKPVFEAMWDWMKNRAWDWIVTVSGNFWNWIKETWDKYKDSIKEFGEWLKEIGSRFVIWSATILGNLWGWIKDKAWPIIIQGAKDFWEWIKGAASKSYEWTVDVLGNVWKWLQETWPKIEDGAIGFWNWLKGLTNKFIAWTITLLGNVWSWLTDKAWPSVVSAAQSFWDWIKGIASKAYEWSIDILGTAWDWLKDTWPKVVDTAKAFWKWLTGLANKTIEWGIDIVGKAWDWLSETWPKIGDAAKGFWKWISGLANKAFEWTIDIAGKAWDWLQNVWPNVVDAAKGFWNWIKDVTSKIVIWSVNAIGTLWAVVSGEKQITLEDIWNKLKGFGKWIEDNAQKGLNWALNIGGNLMKLGATGLDWLTEKLENFNNSINDITRSLEFWARRGDLREIVESLTPEQRDFITQAEMLGQSIARFVIAGFKASFNIVTLIQEGIKSAVVSLTGKEKIGEVAGEIPLVFTAMWAAGAISNLTSKLQKGLLLKALETGAWAMTIYLAFKIAQEKAGEKNIGLQAKDYIAAAFEAAGFGILAGALGGPAVGVKAAALAFTVDLYIRIKFAELEEEQRQFAEQILKMPENLREPFLTEWDKVIMDMLGEKTWYDYMTFQGPMLAKIGYFIMITIGAYAKKTFFEVFDIVAWIWQKLQEKAKEFKENVKAWFRENFIEPAKEVLSKFNPLNYLFWKPTAMQQLPRLEPSEKEPSTFRLPNPFFWKPSGLTLPPLSQQQEGGFTLDVGVDQIAGVVHGGEWVAPAWMVRKYGDLIMLLESIRQRGYRYGGFVGPSGGRVTVGSAAWYALSWQNRIEVMFKDIFDTFKKLLNGLISSLRDFAKSMGIEIPDSVNQYLTKLEEFIKSFDGIEDQFKTESDKILKELDNLGMAAGDAAGKLSRSSQVVSSALQALASHIEWLSYSGGRLQLDLGAGIGNFINILLGGLPQIFPALNWIFNPFSALANFILDMLRPKPKQPEYEREEETTVYGQTFVAGTAREVTYNFNVVFKENILLTEDENAQKTLFEAFVRYVQEHGGVEVVFG